MLPAQKNRKLKIKQQKQLYLIGGFLSLLFVGVIALSLYATESRQEIRPQAAVYPTKTPEPSIPVRPPAGQCYSNIDCPIINEVCIGGGGSTLGHCEFFCTSDSACSSSYMCKSGKCVEKPEAIIPLPTSAPVVIIVKPTDKPVIVTQPPVSKAPVAVISQSAPLDTATEKSETQTSSIGIKNEIYTVDTQVKTTDSSSFIANQLSTTSTIDTKAQQPLSQSSGQNEIKSDSQLLVVQSPSKVKQNQDVAEHLNVVLSTSNLSKSSTTPQEPVSVVDKTVSQFAQIVKGTFETLGTTSTNAKIENQFTTLTTQEVIKTASFVPAPQVVTQIAQIAATNTASQKASTLMGQNANSSEIKMIIQSGGETREYTLPVEKNSLGDVDQGKLNQQVLTAMSNPESGKLISPQVITAAQNAVAEGKVTGTIESNEIKKPLENSLTCFVGIVDCAVDKVSSNTLQQSLAALNEADLVLTVGEGAQKLPTTNAHQVGVKFEGTEIAIDQKVPTSSARDALAYQFFPIINQVKSSLNATTVEGSAPEIKISSAAQTPLAQAAINQLSSEMEVSDSGRIVEAATCQTIIQELGLINAEVEYLDAPKQMAALVTAPSDASKLGNSLSATVSELDKASKGDLTLGTQLQEYVQGSALYQGLAELAFPGIKAVAETQETDNTLKVKVIHVDDINNQSVLDVKVEALTDSEVTAFIIQDNYGNQAIKFSGLDQDTELAKRAAELQIRIASDPNQFTKRVENTLHQAAATLK